MDATKGTYKISYYDMHGRLSSKMDTLFEATEVEARQKADAAARPRFSMGLELFARDEHNNWQQVPRGLNGKYDDRYERVSVSQASWASVTGRGF